MRRLLAGWLAGAVLAVGAGADAAERVTVAALTFVSSAPLFIAAERGYYAEEGLDVEFAFFRAAQPVAVAVAAGDADFGVTGLTAGFFNLAGNGTLKIVAAQSREEPGYDFSAYIVSNQAYEDGFTSVEDYPGHSLGMTQTGSTFHYMIGKLAEAQGFDLSEVSLKPLQSVPNMLAAIKSGQVDSIILPAHIAKPLEERGEAKIIGWVHEHTPWQLGAVFTSTELIEERPEVVRAFVRAYQRAAADYAEAFMQLDASGERTFGEAAEALYPAIEQYTKAKPETVQRAAPYIDPQGRLDVGSVYEIVEWMQEHDLVDAGVDPAAVLDLSFVDGHLNVPEQ